MSEENKQRLKEYQKDYHRAEQLAYKIFVFFFFTWYTY